MTNIWLNERSDYENMSQKRIDNIVKVFLEGVHFVNLNLIFLILIPETNEIKMASGEFASMDSRILLDVPIGKPLWAMITVTRNPKGKNFSDSYGIELHIHSGKDIERGTITHSYSRGTLNEGF